MAKTIRIELSTESIEKARKELERYEKKLTALTAKINNTLLDKAKEEFENQLNSPFVTPARAAAITSAVDYGTTSSNRSSGTFTATGRNEDTGFNILYGVEFGAGAALNGTQGNPVASEFGMGPGSFSPKGHWNDPEGWYYPTGEVDENGKPKYKKTMGTYAAYPVYNTARFIEREGTRIAKEVVEEWL